MCELIDVQPAVRLSRDEVSGHVFTCWKRPDPFLSEGEGSASAKNIPGIPAAGHFAQVASTVELRYVQGDHSRTAALTLNIFLTWWGSGSSHDPRGLPSWAWLHQLITEDLASSLGLWQPSWLCAWKLWFGCDRCSSSVKDPAEIMNCATVSWEYSQWKTPSLP